MLKRAPSIRTLISVIGLSVAVVTAISAPLGYGAIVYLSEGDRLSFEARLNASRVSRYIYQYGPMWPFHKVRLNELIELSNRENNKTIQRIFTRKANWCWRKAMHLPRPCLRDRNP